MTHCERQAKQDAMQEYLPPAEERPSVGPLPNRKRRKRIALPGKTVMPRPTRTLFGCALPPQKEATIGTHPRIRSGGHRQTGASVMPRRVASVTLDEALCETFASAGAALRALHAQRLNRSRWLHIRARAVCGAVVHHSAQRLEWVGGVAEVHGNGGVGGCRRCCPRGVDEGLLAEVHTLTPVLRQVVNGQVVGLLCTGRGRAMRNGCVQERRNFCNELDRAQQPARTFGGRRSAGGTHIFDSRLGSLEKMFPGGLSSCTICGAPSRKTCF